MPGLGQVVRQRRGVRRDAALVGVGGADDRDPQRRGPRPAEGTLIAGSDAVSGADHQVGQQGQGADHDAADDQQHRARREVERVAHHVDDGLDHADRRASTGPAACSTFSGSKYTTIRSTCRM